MEKLLQREYSETRLIRVGQRAAAMLQEKDENGEKISSSYHPDVKQSLQTIRRFWKNNQLTEHYWGKMTNHYNKIADILGREPL